MLNFVFIKFMNPGFSYRAYELAGGASKSSSTGFPEHLSATRRVLPRPEVTGRCVSSPLVITKFS